MSKYYPSLTFIREIQVVHNYVYLVLYQYTLYKIKYTDFSTAAWYGSNPLDFRMRLNLIYQEVHT